MSVLGQVENKNFFKIQNYVGSATSAQFLSRVHLFHRIQFSVRLCLVCKTKCISTIFRFQFSAHTRAERVLRGKIKTETPTQDTATLPSVNHFSRVVRACGTLWNVMQASDAFAETTKSLSHTHTHTHELSFGHIARFHSIFPFFAVVAGCHCDALTLASRVKVLKTHPTLGGGISVFCGNFYFSSYILLFRVVREIEGKWGIRISVRRRATH